MSENLTPNLEQKTPIQEAEEPKKINFQQQFFDFFRFVLTALLIIIPIRVFIAQPFIVSGSSMVPTFIDKDYLIVDQLSYRFNEVERGDTIIMRYPNDPSSFFIKRVVGLPGETVTIKNDQVFVKEIDAEESYLLEEGYLQHTKTREDIQTTLFDGEYFVLGDNRPASSDSRTWGVLPEENIIGKPFVRLFPLSEFKLHPGSDDGTLTEIKLTK